MPVDISLVWRLSRSWPWHLRTRMRAALLLYLVGLRRLAVHVAAPLLD